MKQSRKKERSGGFNERIYILQLAIHSVPNPAHHSLTWWVILFCQVSMTDGRLWCTSLTVLEVQNSRKCAKSSHTVIFLRKTKMQSHFKCFQLKYLLLSNLFKENPDYESTYVFENDFPALLQEEAPSPGMLFLC